MINFSSDSDSDNGLSEDDADFLNADLDFNDKPTTSSADSLPALNQQLLQSIKRKNEFESDILNPMMKKSKNLKTLHDELQNELEASDNEEDEDEDDDFLNLDNVSEFTNKSVGEGVSVSDDTDVAKTRTQLHSDIEDMEYDSEEDSDVEDHLKPGVIEGEKTDFIEKLASELGESSCPKPTEENTSDYNYDITEKLKEMGEISVETVKKGDKTRKSESTDATENEISLTPAKKDSGSDDSDDKNSSERKIGNMRRNIREVMDETQLDEATLAAQRQEMERLRRVQEQQRIIREVGMPPPFNYFFCTNNVYLGPTTNRA